MELNVTILGNAQQVRLMGWRGRIAAIARLAGHSGSGERSHSRRYSGLYALLLHLLLPLLQFLQELLGGFDVLLSVLLLLLLVVGCSRLVVGLIRLVGLIIRGCRVIGGVGRIISGIVGVLTFDGYGISTWSRRHGGSHRRCGWPVIDSLVVGIRLRAQWLRIVVGCAA